MYLLRNDQQHPTNVLGLTRSRLTPGRVQVRVGVLDYINLKNDLKIKIQNKLN